MDGNLGRRKKKDKPLATLYNILQENKVEVKAREGAWSNGKRSQGEIWTPSAVILPPFLSPLP